MEENNQKRSVVIDDMKKNYVKPTCWLCAIFFAAIIVTMVYTWVKVEGTYGIIVFSIADVLLLGLTLTAMVAMYREMSRIHERETIALEEQNEELKKQNEKCIEELEKQIGDLKKKFEELEKTQKKQQ